MNSSGIMISNTKVPDELCDELINYFEFVQEQNPSTILSNEVVHNGATNRKDKSLFLDEINGELTYAINTYLNDAAKEYCDIYNTLYLNDGVIKSTKQKLQKTEIGGGFHTWHCEDTGISATNRVLVWTIYLNDVEEGGETEFLHFSKRVKPKKGRIVIWPAAFPYIHRGNPPLSGEKYILTSWLMLR